MAKKEKNEFSAARKKRRFKIAMLRTKKFIGAVLALAIVCVAVWLFVKEDVAGIIGDRIAASSSSGASMPVEIAGTSVKETFTIGDNVGVLTDGNVALYAKNGKQLLYPTSLYSFDDLYYTFAFLNNDARFVGAFCFTTGAERSLWCVCATRFCLKKSSITKL